MRNETERNEFEQMLDRIVTIDELIAWSSLVISVVGIRDNIENLSADFNPLSNNVLEVKIAEAILKAYAKYYDAETLISDKGKPVSEKYIDDLYHKVIGDSNIKFRALCKKEKE